MDSQELKKELSRFSDELLEIQIKINALERIRSYTEIGLRCLECNKLTYVEPFLKGYHKKFTCDHCGLEHYAAAIYVSQRGTMSLSDFELLIAQADSIVNQFLDRMKHDRDSRNKELSGS